MSLINYNSYAPNPGDSEETLLRKLTGFLGGQPSSSDSVWNSWYKITERLSLAADEANAGVPLSSSQYPQARSFLSAANPTEFPCPASGNLVVGNRYIVGTPDYADEAIAREFVYGSTSFYSAPVFPTVTELTFNPAAANGIQIRAGVGTSLPNLKKFSAPNLQINGNRYNSLCAIQIEGQPNLEEVDFPKLVYSDASLGGVRLSANPKLTTINLPEYIGHFEPLDLRPFTAVSCTALTTVSLPKISRGKMLIFQNNTLLTSISVPLLATAPWGSNGVEACGFDLSGNALDQATVDTFLIDLAANLKFIAGSTLTLTGGTNATPSAAGLAAKAILVARGVTVTHN